MTSDAATADQQPARRSLTRHLAGSGIELGPGHHPFPLHLPGTEVRYVDRWNPEDNQTLFPELKTPTFPRPDVVSNLDTDKLVAFADQSVDFVIASHVLEHLAEPIGQLADIYRVLRPGGVLLLLLPDRRRTFDRNRKATSLNHLLAEHARGLTSVDDDHVEDFLRGTGENLDAMSAQDRAAVFDLHRQRSLHVHCWSETEWAQVVSYCVGNLGQRWELVEMLNNDDVIDSIEFGMVLRRSITHLPTHSLSARFEALLSDLGPVERADPTPAPDPLSPEALHEIGLARQDARNWRVRAEAAEPVVAELRHALDQAKHQPSLMPSHVRQLRDLTVEKFTRRLRRAVRR